MREVLRKAYATTSALTSASEVEDRNHHCETPNVLLFPSFNALLYRLIRSLHVGVLRSHLYSFPVSW